MTTNKSNSYINAKGQLCEKFIVVMPENIKFLTRTEEMICEWLQAFLQEPRTHTIEQLQQSASNRIDYFRGRNDRKAVGNALVGALEIGMTMADDYANVVFREFSIFSPGCKVPSITIRESVGKDSLLNFQVFSVAKYNLPVILD